MKKLTNKKENKMKTKTITLKQKLTMLGLMALIALFAKSCKQDPDALTGKVNIKGIMRVGETAIAEVTGSNGTAGKFAYQWTRTAENGNVMTITGADGATYKITEADADHMLGAVVENEDTTGSISGTATTMPKTYAMEFKDGALKFDVNYEAELDAEEAPEYLEYLETQLGAVVGTPSGASKDATNHLMSQGDRFAINTIYAKEEEVFKGLIWDNEKRAFKVHNDWISIASDDDLSGKMMRNAFVSVTIAKLNTRDSVRLAKAIVPVPQYKKAMQRRDNMFARLNRKGANT